MKYEVGDKVKIKTWEQLKEEYNFISSANVITNVGYWGFNKRMDKWVNEKFLDRILTIEEVVTNSYFMKNDKIRYNWSDEMIECLAEDDKPEPIQSITNRFEILDL